MVLGDSSKTGFNGIALQAMKGDEDTLAILCKENVCICDTAASTNVTQSDKCAKNTLKMQALDTLEEQVNLQS